MKYFCNFSKKISSMHKKWFAPLSITIFFSNFFSSRYEKKKGKNSYFSFSTRKRNEIQQKVNDKYTNIKTSNIIQKSDDTNYSYNDKEEEEEDEESSEESSSNMSCDEEIII